MSNAIKYLESVATIDETDLGDTYETVSLNEAIVACQLQELESLKNSYTMHDADIEARIKDLEKKLKNIKIK